MPFGIDKQLGGDNPSNVKFVDDCVNGIKGENKRTGKPYTKSEKIAICKTALKNSKEKKAALELEPIEELAESAVWTTAYINDLPDSAFLYVEPGDKDAEGKTEPRSKRHFPYKDKSGKVDLPHLRNAIARIPQASISPELKDRLQAKARKLLQGANASLENVEVIFDIEEFEAAMNNGEMDNAMNNHSKFMTQCMQKMMDSGEAVTSEDAKILCERALEINSNDSESAIKYINRPKYNF